MKIGIDARFFGLLGKGLGRYTQKLIEHLECIDNENLYVVFLRKENFDQYHPHNKNFTKALADYPWYSLSEQLFYPRLLAKYNFDLMHFPHFNVPVLYFGKFVLTIHDLILIHFPTLKGTKLNPMWYWIKYFGYKVTIGSAIARAKSIIAVSEFTKNDLIAVYPRSRKKITVTYEACDDFCRISQIEAPYILEKYGIMKPYLLYVGNAYPHKNLPALIDAFVLVQKDFPDMQLALVGKEDYFYLRLREYVKTKKITGVHFLGFVSDQDLDVMYRFAKAYVFPSLYEGFGLPPLEAMAKGVAVVCSDHACMQEILGDAAHWANARNANDLALKISEVLTNKKLESDLISKGYQQIQKYNWDKMARETLNIYHEIKE
jgi:glycosyltransferase involved in cell wall biosynthesis